MTISITDKQASGEPQDSEVLLEVKGVSKKFCRDLKRSLLYGVQDIATEIVGIREKSERLRPKEFWALKDVSFQLRRGEALGLVGANGSGKTTLLRIISGLIKPDTGSVEVNGWLAPLIALGAGFNPILTGQENIYANMSILGLSKKEIDDRFQDVVDFAEIGDAIDAPVQSYSSGMAARLGFACAIHTAPDILLIDEVLAVGDVRFRNKCHRRLHALRQQGTSFILVSHNPQAILNVCNSAIYLSKGQFITSGNTDIVMNRYEEDLFLNGMNKTVGAMFLPDKSERESSGLDIVSLFFRDDKGNMLESPVMGEPTFFCVGYKAYKKFDNSGLNFAIKEVGGEGNFALVLSSFNDKKPFDIWPGEGEIQVRMPYLGLKPGFYDMMVFIRKDSLDTLDSVDSFKFTVRSKENIGQSLFYQPRSWIIQ